MGPPYMGPPLGFPKVCCGYFEGSETQTAFGSTWTFRRTNVLQERLVRSPKSLLSNHQGIKSSNFFIRTKTEAKQISSSRVELDSSLHRHENASFWHRWL